MKKSRAILHAVKAAIRSPFAWPGGYQISIVLADGELICPECARKEFRQIARATLADSRGGWTAAGVECAWEGENRCVQCSRSLTVYESEETVES